jgi:hypothetical protein
LSFPALETLLLEMSPRVQSDAAAAAIWWGAFNGALKLRPARLARLVMLSPSRNYVAASWLEHGHLEEPKQTVDVHRRGIECARTLVREVVDKMVAGGWRV